MVKLRNKADKSDYWDTKQDENKDFVAHSDRGGPNKQRGGVTVQRKKESYKNPKDAERVRDKFFEATMSTVGKKNNGGSSSGFLKHTTKGKQ